MQWKDGIGSMSYSHFFGLKFELCGQTRDVDSGHVTSNFLSSSAIRNGQEQGEYNTRFRDSFIDTMSCITENSKNQVKEQMFIWCSLKCLWCSLWYDLL